MNMTAFKNLKKTTALCWTTANIDKQTVSWRWAVMLM